jgi:hypothetical protein
MINRFLFVMFALTFSFMCSCTNEKADAKPAGVITEEKMAEVLTDIRLLEGVYAGDFQRVDTSEFAIGAYYEQLFVKHQLSRSNFLDSYSYFAQHPEVMLRIETEVSRKLEVMSVSGQ